MNTSIFRRFSLSLIPAFIIAGCKVEPPKPPLVQTLAILPFDNESNDINAPEIMQKLVYEALKPGPYQVVDIEVTNGKLKEVGIVDGGQLPVLDPTKIGKDLGVQGLVYGYVSNFSYVNLGFYIQRKVSLDLKVVDVTTGQSIWEHSGSKTSMSVTVDKKEAQQNFAKGFADQLVDKLFKTPLEEEAKLSTIDALQTLPGFNFVGFQFNTTNSDAAKSLIKGALWNSGPRKK